MCNQPVYAA